MITFEEYGEIEIDEDPLIFLHCGHFYTVSSLDGIMELSQHYVTNPQTGEIVSPKVPHQVGIYGSAPKGCPECRMPLRNIDRYNRVIKRAFLEEATKRFTTQANSRCAKLMEEVQLRETKIEDERRGFMEEWSEAVGEPKDSDTVKSSLEAYREGGIRLHRSINTFIQSVAKIEQPFGRVNSLFASAAARQRDITTDAFKLDESVIQTGFQSRGKCLGLRLDWAILWDFYTISSNSTIDVRIRSALRSIVGRRIKVLLERCRTLIGSAQSTKFPQQEAEAWIYSALFFMLSLRNSQAENQLANLATETSLKSQAEESLERYEKLHSKYPGTLAYLKDDAAKAKRLISGGIFYSFVTTEEKREVYNAMAAQFSGTGHWYYCRNNHPVRLLVCNL